ncbi:hypothetical protein N9242_05555 [Vicingaceae bacterium]|nr:hypothetical protein [Vicingaceae bacterium]
MILSTQLAPAAITALGFGRSGMVSQELVPTVYRKDLFVIPDQILVLSIPPKE